jgi:hypothetical protein
MKERPRTIENTVDGPDMAKRVHWQLANDVSVLRLSARTGLEINRVGNTTRRCIESRVMIAAWRGRRVPPELRSVENLVRA